MGRRRGRHRIALLVVPAIVACALPAVASAHAYLVGSDPAGGARPTLQHRLILNYRAEAEGLRAGDLVDRLLSHITP